jgi:lysophospholipase L1-like esterase
MKNLFIFLFIMMTFGCNKESRILIYETNSKTNKPVKSYTYLALGDSYTIGESVSADASFPFQLIAALKTDTTLVETPKIIAKTGWTTDELITAVKSTTLQPKYDFVTLLIGVNNQYRNFDTVVYRKEFKELLQTAIKYAGGKPENVFVFSIPDWGVTQFAKNSGRNLAKISAEIDFYNAINKEETAKNKAIYLDITPISREATNNLNLIANDGLHPSAIMYGRWVSGLAQLVRVRLK